MGMPSAFSISVFQLFTIPAFPYLPPLMFDPIRAQIDATAAKTAQLRRFL